MTHPTRGYGPRGSLVYQDSLDKQDKFDRGGNYTDVTVSEEKEPVTPTPDAARADASEVKDAEDRVSLHPLTLEETLEALLDTPRCRRAGPPPAATRTTRKGVTREPTSTGTRAG